MTLFLAKKKKKNPWNLSHYQHFLYWERQVLIKSDMVAGQVVSLVLKLRSSIFCTTCWKQSLKSAIKMLVNMFFLVLDFSPLFGIMYDSWQKFFACHIWWWCLLLTIDFDPAYCTSLMLSPLPVRAVNLLFFHHHLHKIYLVSSLEINMNW